MDNGMNLKNNMAKVKTDIMKMEPMNDISWGSTFDDISFGNGYIWPEIFVTGIIPDNYPKELLCADGLCAWGICMAGSNINIPEKFGEVMFEISQRLGVSATDSSLMKYAERIGY